MKTKFVLSFMLIVSVLLSSCGLLNAAGVKVINPSNTITSENQNVSGYNAVDFSTFGKLNIVQGDTESLNISGPDNLVPEISTTVSNGTLTIKNKESFTVSSLSTKDILTFTLVVKDLSTLLISGAGDVQVETLNTPSMDLTLSGAGKVQVNQITTDNFKIDLSGAGSLELSGSATQATLDLSGAGSINASELKIQNANITLSGLGSATLWVTDQLTGNISGAGSVSYYGYPQTNTNTSGLGSFKSLGSK